MKKTKLIRCSEVADHICDHLDTDTKTEKCRQIRRHIRSCPNCYAYLDSMKKTVRLYKLEKAPTLRGATRKKLYAVLHLAPPPAPRSRR